MSAWAKPGVKCVCIDPRNTTAFPPFSGELVEGSVYTIKRVMVVDTVVAVVLEEVRRFVLGIEGTDRRPFALRRFRPLAYPSQSLEHDIEAFKKIAGHVPVLDSEDA